jgi:hypothetical protein
MDGVHPPKPAPSECGPNTDNVSKYHRPAIVTRYPTGCFGIEYNGSMFHWWGFEEAGVHAELERLHIHPCTVKWQERYYDQRYPLSDPRSYALREFIPNNGSAVLNPLDDEFEEILGGAWAVIRTSDGWEIENQHSMSTFPLTSTDMDSARIEGAKLARKIETRFRPNENSAGTAAHERKTI